MQINLRAQDVRNERQVAIKAIMIDMAMSAMQQEVEILSLGRDCPQIVQYFGAISEADHLKLILEFMDGLSLDRYGTERFCQNTNPYNF